MPQSIPSDQGCARAAWLPAERADWTETTITDSLAGVEYDAGCWIGRLVAERISTGRAEATTRLLLQLELVGLSRLGSNPLSVLKENIPGYMLLREDRSDPPLRSYAGTNATPASSPAAADR